MVAGIAVVRGSRAARSSSRIISRTPRSVSGASAAEVVAGRELFSVSLIVAGKNHRDVAATNSVFLVSSKHVH